MVQHRGHQAENILIGLEHIGMHLQWHKGWGASALEVILALAIISLGLLGVASVYTFGTAAGRTSDRQVVALRLAEELLEKIRVQNMAFEAGYPPAWLQPHGEVASEEPVPLDSPPFRGQFAAESGFLRQVRMRRLAQAGDYRANLVELDVRVGWSLEGRERWVELKAVHARP